MEIIQRADKGRLDYRARSLKHSDLEKFVEQRNLHVDCLNRYKLIAALEQADKGYGYKRRTPPKEVLPADGDDRPPLMRLPPELRLLIYEYAVADPWGYCCSDPPEPAITRVSIQLRREALSLWHGFNTFQICLEQTIRQCTRPHSSDQEVTRELARWHTECTETSMGFVRHVIINIRSQIHHADCSIRVDVRRGIIVSAADITAPKDE